MASVSDRLTKNPWIEELIPMKRSFISLSLVIILALSQAVAAEEVKTEVDGLTLNANLEKSGDWPAGPVVLLTHGTLAHRGMEIIRSLQTMLAEREVSSLAINLSLGIDDRPAAMYDCPTPHTHKHTDAVGEIVAWVDWLKEQGVQKAAILGHSRGGNQVARYAAGQPDTMIKSVILVAPQTWEAPYVAEDYAKRYKTSLQPLLAKAQELVSSGKGEELMGPMGFIYCEDTRASAASVVSYYAADRDMDTPELLSRIDVPVVVIAGSEDNVVAGLVEKTEPLADGEKIELLVLDGADHFFRDLYAEEIADVVAERIAE